MQQLLRLATWGTAQAAKSRYFPGHAMEGPVCPQVVRVLEADDDVANCCCPHPHLPVLATSGIENVIKLWAPLQTPVACNASRLIARNQDRLKDSPNMLRNLNLHPRLIQVGRQGPTLPALLPDACMTARGCCQLQAGTRQARHGLLPLYYATVATRQPFAVWSREER